MINFLDYKINILVKKGLHNDYVLLNKQLNDKERIAAAKQNINLMNYIEGLIYNRVVEIISTTLL